MKEGTRDLLIGLGGIVGFVVIVIMQLAGAARPAFALGWVVAAIVYLFIVVYIIKNGIDLIRGRFKETGE